MVNSTVHALAKLLPMPQQLLMLLLSLLLPLLPSLLVLLIPLLLLLLLPLMGDMSYIT